MTLSEKKPAPYFSQPVRQILLMLLVVGLVGSGAWMAFGAVESVFLSSPWLNGVIFGVFILGVLGCFWQVLTLISAVGWIEGFAGNRPGADIAAPPRMLLPLANLLRTRGARMQLSSSSTRSILESVSTRIEEARDITRYLASLLIFLGLLGTFYGLATTVPAVVDTIRSLAPQEGETSVTIFERLMGGLEQQLGGMGTAFSSSLLGLGGSLVVGLLELFAGHGQNRFYSELEEWLSSITRVGIAAGEEGGDGALAAVIDQMSEQIEVVKALVAQSDTSWAMVDERLTTLAMSVDKLADYTEAQVSPVPVLERMATAQDRMIDLQSRMIDGQARVHEAQTRMVESQERVIIGQDRIAEVEERVVEGQNRIAEGQTKSHEGQERIMTSHARVAEGQEVIALGLDRLLSALSKREGAAPQAATGQSSADDAESRMRLRSIEAQLLKILEEVAVGRQESVTDLRADIRELTRAVRSLGGRG